MKNSTVHLCYLIECDKGRYVGITTQKGFGSRKNAHRHSGRFGYDFSMTPIFSTKSRECVMDMESYFVEKYDTYHNGLNRTPTGKGNHHNSDAFTTLGYRFSEKSRLRMSATRNARIASGEIVVKGHGFSDEAKRKMSEARKGRIHSSRLSWDDVRSIRAAYHNREELPGVFIKGETDVPIFYEYERAFAHTRAEMYGVSCTSMIDLVRGVSYKTPSPKQKIPWECVEAIRDEFKRRVPLVGVLVTTSDKVFHSYDRAFSHVWANKYGITHVQMHKVITYKVFTHDEEKHKEADG